MDFVQALVLGLVQGVTEFLPISSSGFLILVPEWLGWEVQSLSFDAIVHLATLAAVVAALWGDVAKIGKSFVSKEKSALVWQRLGWLVILATIPVMVVGFLAQDFVEVSLRSSKVVAISFIVWGIVLYGADKFVKSRAEKKVENVRMGRALTIGLAQVIALIPGTSRSGITITAGLFSGLNREAATRFSFLLAIPTILAAGVLKSYQVLNGEVDLAVLPLVVGAVAAFISAFFTIRFLLSFLQKRDFTELAIFRIVIGLIILFL
jgi:undecaprenyl-diphosphatase